MLILIVCGILASVVVLGIMAWRAPMGYEDEDGFHFGEPPEIAEEEKKEQDAA